ncbi:MAG: 2-succinyl-5-enolpyruvyl-6-hydroxy-3-cyclohexene-1-carboxylic-acid synthase [Opitutales bacterium]
MGEQQQSSSRGRYFENAHITANTNLLWSGFAAETLACLGLRHVVISPGSRSAPLAIAFAAHPRFNVTVALDERSAGFFALGAARQSGLPVVLICTSGTAAANYYPAVIEASISRVPLLVLTADRPGELRDCTAGQVIDQLRLFGRYPSWQAEVALPEATEPMLRYLRQTMVHACERCLMSAGGPVHLNVPFREPLAPLAEEDLDLEALGDLPAFFEDVSAPPVPNLLLTGEDRAERLKAFGKYRRGLIVVGPHFPRRAPEFAKRIGQISEFLGWPVLAEGLGSLRNYQRQAGALVTQYDCILRSEELAGELEPEAILQIGPLPTSKILRAWLEGLEPITWIIDGSSENRDPLHRRTQHLRCTFEQFFADLRIEGGVASDFLQRWQALEAEALKQVHEVLDNESALFEGKAAWMLSRSLPQGTHVCVANSMPVRDVEFFWAPNDLNLCTVCNRGANGIDGTLSTALGMAHVSKKPSVLLTGDLALLHDGGGALLSRSFSGHLTIVLLDNGGGGIFHNLPIARFDPPFTDLFVTPQSVDFAQLAKLHGWTYESPDNWNTFERLVRKLPDQGVRLIHLRCDAKEDVPRRGRLLLETAEGLE